MSSNVYNEILDKTRKIVKELGYELRFNDFTATGLYLADLGEEVVDNYEDGLMQKLRIKYQLLAHIPVKKDTKDSGLLLIQCNELRDKIIAKFTQEFNFTEPKEYVNNIARIEGFDYEGSIPLQADDFVDVLFYYSILITKKY